MTAYCTDGSNTVVDENNCDVDYVTSHGGYVSGGLIFLGGASYRYYYYGGKLNGRRVTGGTTVAPVKGTISTPSGRTILRGGLGAGGGSTGSVGG